MKIPIQPKTIEFTKEGYQKVLDEKLELLKKRPEAVEDLRKSREMGDSSENGYYKASRAKLSSIDSRLRYLERLIRLGRIVAPTRSGFVDIGSRVTITDKQSVLVYSIVGGYESDPTQGTISHKSPVGRQLIGRRVGDNILVITPSGNRNFVIEKIE